MESKIVIHGKNDLKSKIYTIRGMQVMLDFDLAEIYGYTTKRFNEQVRNNIEKFDEDFRFQLTWEEMEIILSLRSRSKISTLNTGRGSNVKYLPYAFTEQGIYMLMTVLRGDLAIKQSKILIRLFKTMKDFIVEREHFIIGYDDVAKFSDNIRHGLHKQELDDFIKEYPNVELSFKITDGIFHDRYVILDFGTKNEKIYHCGASSKDAGKKVCTISTITDNAVYKPLIKKLLKNRELVLS